MRQSELRQRKRIRVRRAQFECDRRSCWLTDTSLLSSSLSRRYPTSARDREQVVRNPLRAKDDPEVGTTFHNKAGYLGIVPIAWNQNGNSLRIAPLSEM